MIAPMREQHELPGMPEPQDAKPRKGSKAWKKAEIARFYALAREHGGLTSAFFVAVVLGVSRQRVHQLAEAGTLPSYDVLGKRYFPCDVVEEFAARERRAGRPTEAERQAA